MPIRVQDYLNTMMSFSESRAAAHDLMLWDGVSYAITNNETLDYEGMFTDGFIFSEQAVITFKYMIGSRSMRPFALDCYSAFNAMDFSYEMVNLLKDKTAKPKSYLIELTNDINIIDEFNNMKIVDGSPTHVTSGLLRSLPVIAKGTNPRKAIIVISDGIDSGSSTRGPYAMTERLFKTYDLCKRVREGLLRYPEGTPTQAADIFFIFTVNNSETAHALDLWRNYCAGDNVFLATNYQDIINVLTGIAKKSSVKFINKNEPE
ncbi:Uncharacterised protein [Raoultella planticola]|uniref:VWFA domain-containing protein n=1 Tax=Raoultella planticola TaxID=575 RepID=A0A485A4A1_RAOPL|nr:Uncharacterised protein [Raoultella planticola]